MPFNLVFLCVFFLLLQLVRLIYEYFILTIIFSDMFSTSFFPRMTETLSMRGSVTIETTIESGKWRWAILLGAFEALVFTMGLLQTMGVYALSIADEFKSTSAETGWIISSALAFLLAFGKMSQCIYLYICI